MAPYVAGLSQVIDLKAIAGAKLKMGVDPMGGASLPYWAPIAEAYQLDLEVVNPNVDPTFAFMTVDQDGQIRMDCSSPYAMAGLIGLKDRFDIAFGNDPDSDRHGIVTPSAGLMNPNHYLATAVWYLFQHRPGWRADAAVGKTLVSSSMIDRVAALHGAAAGRGAGGLQVVCGWAAGWLVWLRGRGKRRGLVPAAGWHGLDHRQRMGCCWTCWRRRFWR